MKKFKMLLVVTSFLMVLGFVLPLAGSNPNQGITICNDGPPVDTIGIS